MIEIQPVQRPPRAAVRLPGSKSYTNRALLCAALADGRSRLLGALFSDDTVYMATALSALGFAVEEDSAGTRFEIHGAGGRIPRDEAELRCGNAGTAVRFLTALCATGHGRYQIDGDSRMRQRPQQPLLDALEHLGVRAYSAMATGCPPLRIIADGCRGGRVSMPGNVSSQYFSALAMAAPAMSQGIVIEVEGELVSRPYLDMTAQVMASFGVVLEHDDYHRIRVASGQHYTGCDYVVEPDASTASYFFALAAVTGGEVTVRGLGRDSLQGDLRFVDILAEMGCRVTDSGDGLTVSGPEQLLGVTVDMSDISDVALTLAAIAPYAATPTEIRGIAHTRHQESDRVAAMATELGRLGVAVTEYEDGWRIEPSTPQPGAVETYHDHRLAMSLSLLGLRTPGIAIRGPECVAKTFPDYFNLLRALTSEGLV